MIPFGDPSASYQAHKMEVDAAIQRVLGSGWYVLGKEVKAFEEEFASFHGEEFTRCGSGQWNRCHCPLPQELGLGIRR